MSAEEPVRASEHVTFGAPAFPALGEVLSTFPVVGDGPHLPTAEERDDLWAETVATPLVAHTAPGEPLLTAAEWIDVRDLVADVAKEGFEPGGAGTGHFEVAEQLLRQGLINVPAALKQVRA